MTETNNELQDILREAYEHAVEAEAAGDFENTVHALMANALVSRWYDDCEYQKLVEDEMIIYGTANLVSRFLQHIRTVTAGNNVNSPATKTATRISEAHGMRGRDGADTALLERTTASLFLYPLYGGKPIGKALRPEVLQSVAERQKQAAGTLKAIHREELVAEDMSDDNTPVAECITAERLQELFDQVNTE